MVFDILWIFPCSQLLDEDFSKVTRVDMSKTGVVKNWNEDKGFGFIGLEWAVKIWGWVKTYYYSYGPLPVISTYNPIYRMYNPTYNHAVITDKWP